ADQPPRLPGPAVQTYVARLRKKPGAIVTARPGGYQLTTTCRDLDQFRQAVAVADAARLRDDDATEHHHLTTALALWRRDGLANVPSESLQRDVVPRLVEELLHALERRIELELRWGQGAQLIPELRALTATYPIRERFWCQLILALTQAGRPAEAL